MSASRTFTPVEWYDQQGRTQHLFGFDSAVAAVVTAVVTGSGGALLGGSLAAPGGGLTPVLGVSLVGWVSCVLALRVYVASPRAAWLHYWVTTWSFWAGRHPSRLPRWTLSDGMFPQARRYLSSQRLSPAELECFDVLVDEWDGSIGELLLVCRSVVSPAS